MSISAGMKILGIIIGVIAGIWLLTIIVIFKDIENALIPIIVMGVIPVAFLLAVYWVIKGFVEKNK